MEKKNIYQRMHAIMKDVSYIQKEEKKVNNQYTFVSHDAVTAKIRGAMVEHGVVSIPSVTKHSQDGNRTDVDVSIKFVNIDDPEQFVITESFGYGIDPQDKGPGKAYSYAVKYGLLKAFSLETGDDPERDSINYKPKAIEQDTLTTWRNELAEIKTAEACRAFFTRINKFCADNKLVAEWNTIKDEINKKGESLKAAA